MNCLMLIFVVLLIISVWSCAAFQLTWTPHMVSVNSEQTLNCLALTDTNQDISIVWIRILKKSGQRWSRLAELRESDKCVITYGDISGEGVAVAGEVGSPLKTYLRLKWKVAGINMLGTYRCDVIGVTKAEDIRVLTSEPITITNDTNMKSDGGINEYLSRAIVRLQELSHLVKLVQDKQSSLSAEVETLAAELEMKSQQVTLTSAINTTATRAPTTDDAVWPDGSYALLMPETGCPQNSNKSEWKEGFYVIQMESDEVTNQTDSSQTHLAKPLYEVGKDHHYMNLLFCLLTNNRSGAQWPAGTYCIGRLAGQCPSGFLSGYIRLTEEARRSNIDISKDLPDIAVTVDGTLIHFCCRNDGNPTNPITLPTTSPFFLYRYGGVCQVVTGMTIAQESMTIDTEDENNNDAYENVHHPDGQLNDVIAQLCYYERE